MEEQGGTARCQTVSCKIGTSIAILGIALASTFYEWSTAGSDTTVAEMLGFADLFVPAHLMAGVLVVAGVAVAISQPLG